MSKVTTVMRKKKKEKKRKRCYVTCKFNVWRWTTPWDCPSLSGGNRLGLMGGFVLFRSDGRRGHWRKVLLSLTRDAQDLRRQATIWCLSLNYLDTPDENTVALQYSPATVSVCFISMIWNLRDRQPSAALPLFPRYPATALPPFFPLSSSLCISQSGLKIDENLLWDYVLWAANNVEEPSGLPLPKQRCNKARSWEIHGCLMETKASGLLCYIYRYPFCLILLHPALVCLALPACWPVIHLRGYLASCCSPRLPCSLPRHCCTE